MEHGKLLMASFHTALMLVFRSHSHPHTRKRTYTHAHFISQPLTFSLSLADFLCALSLTRSLFLRFRQHEQTFHQTLF